MQVCYGLNLRPSNFGQCQYALITKPPVSVHYLDFLCICYPSHFVLNVLLFQVGFTIFHYLLTVRVKRLNSFSQAISLKVNYIFNYCELYQSFKTLQQGTKKLKATCQLPSPLLYNTPFLVLRLSQIHLLYKASMLQNNAVLCKVDKHELDFVVLVN